LNIVVITEHSLFVFKCYKLLFY